MRQSSNFNKAEPVNHTLTGDVSDWHTGISSTGNKVFTPPVATGQ